MTGNVGQLTLPVLEMSFLGEDFASSHQVCGVEFKHGFVELEGLAVERD